MLRTCKKCSAIESEIVPFCKDRGVCVECRTKYHKAWQQLNSESYTKYHRNYQVKREKQDLGYRISRQLRKRLASAVGSDAKAGSATKDLGCTATELKVYLESQLQPGMTWNNWKLDGWHIDHIKPLASFDLTNPVQYKEACHYTNLQPLWAIDNLKKRDLYEEN
jgi:hypothetical protein